MKLLLVRWAAKKAASETQLLADEQLARSCNAHRLGRDTATAEGLRALHLRRHP